MLKAVAYAVAVSGDWPGCPWSLVATDVCSAAGTPVSARNMAASRNEDCVTNRADRAVWVTNPGLGSRRNPAVAVMRTMRDSCPSETPMRSATSFIGALSFSGMHARTWKSPSHRKHARIWLFGWIVR